MSEHLLKYVPTLTKDNYRIWKIKYIAAVLLQGISEQHLTGATPWQNTAAASKSKNIAYTLLVATLSDPLIHLIEKYDPSQLTEAWKAVANFFKTDSRQAQRLRKTNFFKLTYKRGELFSRWVADLQQMANEINDFHKSQLSDEMKQNAPNYITDKEMVDALLEGVQQEHRREFEAIVTVIDNMPHLPTFDETVKKLTPIAARAGLDSLSNIEQASPAADQPAKEPWRRVNIKNPHLLPCHTLGREGSCKYGDKCIFSHDKEIMKTYDARKDKYAAKPRPTHSSYGRTLRPNRCKTCKSSKHSSEEHGKAQHDHFANQIKEARAEIEKLSSAMKNLESGNQTQEITSD